jgi:hypothetical protein
MNNPSNSGESRPATAGILPGTLRAVLAVIEQEAAASLAVVRDGDRPIQKRLIEAMAALTLIRTYAETALEHTQ